MKSAKNALITSVITMLVCVAMLAGTTFAWFTDTASTGVNKIQAGILDVVLEYKDENGEWKPAEGRTMKWLKTDGTDVSEADAVLWEPGATYRLRELRVRNGGDLHLKYKLVITGIIGSEKLLEVIDFTYGNGINIADEVYLAPGQTTEGIVIEGHMRENAGNEYQGLSIDGINFMVIATQNTVEHDSESNQYDAATFYPDISKGIPTADAQYTATGKNFTAVFPQNVLPANTMVEMTIVPTDNRPNLEILTTVSGTVSDTFEINVAADGQPVDLSANTEAITVTMVYKPGLVASQIAVYHKDQAISGFTYDSTTGVIEFKTTSFSPYTIVYAPQNVHFATDAESFVNIGKNVKSGDTIYLLADIPNALRVNILEPNVTIDGMNHTMTHADKNGIVFGFGQKDQGCQNITLKNITINGGVGAVTATGANTEVTIEGGVYNGGKNGDNICIWATDGAKVTIKGGTFTVGQDASGAGNSVVYATGGATVTIEGGFFYTNYAWNNFYYVLNQNNGNSGNFVVKGGTFVNYDPSKGDDNLGGNFVPDGYESVAVPQTNGVVWYTVVEYVVKYDENNNATKTFSVSNTEELAAVATIIKPGDTVSITADFTMDRLVKFTTNNIFFEGNGHTITSNREVELGKTLIAFGEDGKWCQNIKVSNINFNGKGGRVFHFHGGDSSTLENVKIDGEFYLAVNFYGTHGATLNNCDFKSSATKKHGGTVFANQQSANRLILNNTTIDEIYVNVRNNDASTLPNNGVKVVVNSGSTIGTLYLPDGTTLVPYETNGDGTITTIGYIE